VQAAGPAPTRRTGPAPTSPRPGRGEVQSVCRHLADSFPHRSSAGGTSSASYQGRKPGQEERQRCAGASGSRRVTSLCWRNTRPPAWPARSGRSAARRARVYPRPSTPRKARPRHDHAVVVHDVRFRPPLEQACQRGLAGARMTQQQQHAPVVGDRRRVDDQPARVAREMVHEHQAAQNGQRGIHDRLRRHARIPAQVGDLDIPEFRIGPGDPERRGGSKAVPTTKGPVVPRHRRQTGVTKACSRRASPTAPPRGRRNGGGRGWLVARFHPPERPIEVVEGDRARPGRQAADQPEWSSPGRIRPASRPHSRTGWRAAASRLPG